MLSYDSPRKGQEPAAAGVHLSPRMSAVNGSAAPNKPTPVAAPGSAAMPNHGFKHHHIWLVTGPAGCGKSSVAEYLSKALDMPYIEGDLYHPAANVEKMSHGIPLTDEDRWDWLTALREESVHRINDGNEGVVLTCSALKRKYRDVIRVAAYYDHHIHVHFIYLDAPEEVLMQRVAHRQGHYMGANMVHSQFDILERPSATEKDVMSIDVSRTLDEVKVDAIAKARQLMEVDQINSS